MPKRQTPKAVTAAAATRPPVDHRTAMERIEDVALQNRIDRLTAQQKWAELEMCFMMYGSSLSEREPGHHGLGLGRG